MKYYRDINYFIYLMDFPHMGIPGLIVSNSDGTANIYINTLYAVEKQNRAIRHELRHFVKGHLHCDYMTIEEKEMEADLDDESCVFGEDFSFVEYEEKPEPKRLPNVFKEKPPGTIPLFHSLEAFGNYMVAMREQYQQGI